MAPAVRNDWSDDNRPESDRAKSSQGSKGERLDLRIAPDVKGLIERAAALSGLPVSGYILSVAVPHAKHVVQEAQQLTLSNRDRDRFLAALDDDDAKPNPALLRAAQRFNAATR